MSAPRAFVSYSWDDDSHKKWVADLAAALRADGVETILDQWHAVPGDPLPAFMEKEIRENDYVLIICTPNYRLKSNDRKGGVGYEGYIMTAEVYGQGNHRKFIPILARGTWENSAPSWLISDPPQLVSPWISGGRAAVIVGPAERLVSCPEA